MARPAMHSPLMRAVLNKRYNSVENLFTGPITKFNPDYFKDAKQDLNEIFEEGIAPIHHAVYYEDEKMVELLLKHGADINLQDIEGNTPLMLAALRGSQAIVRLLLTHNAEIKVYDKHGNGALQILVINGEKDILRMLANDFGMNLLEEQAELDKKVLEYLKLIESVALFEDFNLPLTYTAAKANRPDMFVFLVKEFGFKVDENYSYDGCTALTIAAYHDYTQMVHILIDELNAQVDFYDFKWNTPLHYACWGERPNVVNYLLKKGASQEIKNHYDMTPADAANQKSNIANWLILKNGREILPLKKAAKIAMMLMLCAAFAIWQFAAIASGVSLLIGAALFFGFHLKTNYFDQSINKLDLENESKYSSDMAKKNNRFEYCMENDPSILRDMFFSGNDQKIHLKQSFLAEQYHNNAEKMRHANMRL